jgi:MFS family permease
MKKRSVLSNILDAWSPLANPVFRAIFIASVVSNVGSWMQTTGGSWLMTSLTTSSVLVALMQTAASLPLFLFSLPAGSLADIFDRRKLLIYAQVLMLIMAAILSFLTFIHMVTPLTLIVLTFALGIGNAFNAPAWLAAVPETVGKKDLSKALTLNSVSYNVSIAIGPAIAGLMLSRVDTGWIFLLNAVSFIAVIGVLLFWKNKHETSALPAEKLSGAMRATIRYMFHAPLLQNVLIRSGIFIAFGSSFWALLPAVARFRLHMDAGGFGILYGFMGIGAAVGATVMPRIQKKLSIDLRLPVITIVFGIALLMLGYLTQSLLIYLAMFLVGFAWIVILSTFNIFVQSVVAGWIKARAIGIYVLVIQGGLALGSIGWGIVADHYSIPQTFLFSVIGLLAGLLAIRRFPLETKNEINLLPSLHLQQPVVLHDIHHDQGPVLISIVYTIDPKNSGEFMEVAKKLGAVRKRSGSIRWGIFKDTADHSRYIENFITASWGEHLRQHHRLTVYDKAVEDKVKSFQKGSTPPPVFHYIAKKML